MLSQDDNGDLDDLEFFKVAQLLHSQKSQETKPSAKRKSFELGSTDFANECKKKKSSNSPDTANTYSKDFTEHEKTDTLTQPNLHECGIQDTNLEANQMVDFSKTKSESEAKPEADGNLFLDDIDWNDDIVSSALDHFVDNKNTNVLSNVNVTRENCILPATVREKFPLTAEEHKIGDNCYSNRNAQDASYSSGQVLRVTNENQHKTSKADHLEVSKNEGNKNSPFTFKKKCFTPQLSRSSHITREHDTSAIQLSSNFVTPQKSKENNMKSSNQLTSTPLDNKHKCQTIDEPSTNPSFHKRISEKLSSFKHDDYQSHNSALTSHSRKIVSPETKEDNDGHISPKRPIFSVEFMSPISSSASPSQNTSQISLDDQKDVQDTQENVNCGKFLAGLRKNMANTSSGKTYSLAPNNALVRPVEQSSSIKTTNTTVSEAPSTFKQPLSVSLRVPSQPHYSARENSLALHLEKNKQIIQRTPTINQFQPEQSQESVSLARNNLGKTSNSSEWNTPRNNVGSCYLSASSNQSSSKGKKKRKFPGPAGVLPKLRSGQSLAEMATIKPAESPRNIPQQNVGMDLPGSQSAEDRFQEEPWVLMLKDLEPGAKNILREFNVASVIQKASKKQLVRGKVPVICVMIDQVNTQNADASVVIRDPSGEMKGTIHRQLVKEYPTELQMGSVLVLRQCGVFSPSAKSHYLNITTKNLVRIYPKTRELTTIKINDFVSNDFILPEPVPPNCAESSPYRIQCQSPTLPFSVVGRERMSSPGHQSFSSNFNKPRGPSVNNATDRPYRPHMANQRLPGGNGRGLAQKPGITKPGNNPRTMQPGGTPRFQNRAVNMTPMSCTARSFTPRSNAKSAIISKQTDNKGDAGENVHFKIAQEKLDDSDNQTNSQNSENKSIKKTVTKSTEQSSKTTVAMRKPFVIKQVHENHSIEVNDKKTAQLNFSIQDDMDDLLQGLDEEIFSDM